MIHKVLVTGGSGFIGQYVLKELQRQHIQIENWDRLEGINLFNQIKISTCVDVIIHLAAQLEILDVNPITELVMNVEGTLHMLELARKFDVPKFVFISSADVYGEPFLVSSKETNILKPFWSYAASKVAAEVYVRQYEELYGIKTIIIRPSIVTGIGEWYGRFVTLNMAKIREEQPILIFGNGKQTRDFVSVQDVAHLITLSTIKDFATPETFNAGSGKRTQIIDVGKYLAKISNSEIKFMNPKVGEFGRKPHEQINQQLDTCHASFVLNWKPVRGLSSLLSEELKWVQKMDDKTFEEWTKHPRY